MTATALPSQSFETVPVTIDVAGGRDVHAVDMTISYTRGSAAVVPVSGLTFYAPSSRITALVGRSGSGKTSILSCIAGMLQPTSGTIWLGDIDVTSLRGKALDQYRRRHIGVVHQAYNLIPSLTAVENVSVPLTLIGMSRREAHARFRPAEDHHLVLGRLGPGQCARRAV